MKYGLAYVFKEIKILSRFKFQIVSSVITQLFFGMFKIYTLNAFASADILKSPLNNQQIVSYIWITQIFFSIIPWTVNVKDFNNILDGSVAYELTRPIELFDLVFIKTFAWRVSNCLVRLVPMLIIVALMFPIFPGLVEIALVPDTIASLLLFWASISLGVILSVLITTVIYSISFYFTTITNLLGLIASLSYFLSGMVIPLEYFPKSIQVFLALQPFKGIVDTPAMIFSGKYHLQQGVMGILLQMGWIILFLFVNKITYRKGESNIEVSGG